MIDEKDLKVEVLRYGPDSFDWQFSAGPHNTLVRLTHLPTGLVAESGSERTQKLDKAKALEKLEELLATRLT